MKLSTFSLIICDPQLKDSVWKCSQIIPIIQKEGKIVFLPVQTESTIKNTPEPPSPFLRVRPDPARPQGTSCSHRGDNPTARPCWCVLGGIPLSATVICSGRRGDEDLEPHPAHADPPAIGDGHQGLVWRARGRRSRREGKVSTCLAFICHVAGVECTLVASSRPPRSCVP